MKPELELLTVREAAALMRLGRDTTYSLIAEGRIPHVRVGRQIRISRKALLDHFEQEAKAAVRERPEVAS